MSLVFHTSSSRLRLDYFKSLSAVTANNIVKTRMRKVKIYYFFTLLFVVLDLSVMKNTNHRSQTSSIAEALLETDSFFVQSFVLQLAASGDLASRASEAMMV